MMEVDAGAPPPAIVGGESGEPSLKRLKQERTDAARPWVEKYRPSTLDDLVAHKEIIGVLRRLIQADKLPHTLLYGPPGTGKTSTILAAARDMYGANFKAMTLELNASDDRGIDVVRNQIKEFAGTRRLFSRGIKLIILDEADMMTNDAQFALRRVIEKYTSNARFCLICNYANKIIPALQSRCTKFRFAPLAPDQVRGRATQGCFNVTSTRVFSDRTCQKKHPPFENLKRDDHSSKNQLKRVETDRDMRLQS